jgi:acyl-coenzyme A thioesterase PaaI-like protein
MKAILAVALTTSVLGFSLVATSANAMNLTHQGGGTPSGGNPGGSSHGGDIASTIDQCSNPVIYKKLVHGKQVWIKKCQVTKY